MLPQPLRISAALFITFVTSVTLGITKAAVSSGITRGPHHSEGVNISRLSVLSPSIFSSSSETEKVTVPLTLSLRPYRYENERMISVRLISSMPPGSSSSTAISFETANSGSKLT